MLGEGILDGVLETEEGVASGARVGVWPEYFEMETSCSFGEVASESSDLLEVLLGSFLLAAALASRLSFGLCSRLLGSAVG